jgi:hypothetical protein
MTGLGGLWPDRSTLAYAHGAYVLVEREGIWVSADTQAWAAAYAPVSPDDMIELTGLVSGGPGFVAVGTEDVDADDDGSPEDSRAIVLTSVDGRQWKRLDDWRFEHSAINYVARSRQGIVAFGSTRGTGASIWTSVDGTEWLKATNDTGLEVAKGVQLVVESGGRLTAFVGHPGPTYDDPSGTVDVWQTEGRADWQKVGALPDPSGAWVREAVFGGGHWLALGVAPSDDGSFKGVWTSTDGATWTRGIAPPEHARSAIAGWADGLIAVGYTGSSPGETCGQPGPFVGRSAIRMNGGAWQDLPPTEGAAASSLLVVGDRVLAVGLSARGEVEPVRWMATLPRSPVHVTPQPTPTPRIPGDGCGS